MQNRQPENKKSIHFFFILIFLLIVFIFRGRQVYAQGEVPSASNSSTPVDPMGNVVNQGGAFIERYPIEIPEGRKSMQPNLALAYQSGNSAEANGLLGIGWTLSGFPAIARIAWDKGIKYEGDDEYASMPSGWNGSTAESDMRLTETSSNTYHTFDNQKARYVSSLKWDKMCGDGPCYWIMEDGNGNRFYFGGDHYDNACVGGQGDETFHATVWGKDPNQINKGVNAWLLYKVEDIHGNYYKITYDNSGTQGRPLPQSIIYTLHPDDPGCNESVQTNCREVSFDFEPRTDMTAMPQQYQVRLKTISVSSKGQPVRHYNLEYEYTTEGRSRLVSIQEFGADGKSSLPKTTFKYQDAPTVDHFNMELQPDVPRLGQGPVPGTLENVWQSHMGDINGDGLDDLVRLYRNAHRVELYYQASRRDGSGLDTYRSALIEAVVSEDQEKKLPTFDKKLPTFIADYTGNGCDDVLVPAYTEGYYDWVTDNNKTSMKWINGRINLFYFGGSASGMYQAELGSFELDQSQACGENTWRNLLLLSGDIDGDGKADVILLDPVCGLVKVRSYSKSIPDPHDESNPWPVGITSADQLVAAFLVDINNDGFQDLVVGYSQGANIRIAYAYGSSKGLGEVAETVETTSFAQLQRSLHRGDFNGDGMTDLLFAYTGFNGTRHFGSVPFTNHAGLQLNPVLSSAQGPLAYSGVSIYDTNKSYAYGLRSGYWDGVQDTSTYTYAHYATWQYHTGDFNGDGIDDFIQVYRGAMGKYIYSYHGSPSGELISQVPVQEETDGCIFGQTSSNCTAYEMNQDGDYTEHRWKSAVGDLNGDGRSDLVLAYYGPQGLKIEYAPGSSAGLGTLQVLYNDATEVATGAAIAPVAFPDENWGALTELFLSDVNGDGKDDLVLVNNAGWVDEDERKTWVLLSEPMEPDLLVSVENRLGGVTMIEYQQATLHGDSEHGQAIELGQRDCNGSQTCGCGIPNTKPRSLATRVEQWNGLYDTFSNRYAKRYVYKNGRVRPGPIASRANLGFEKVIRIDAQSLNISTSEYRQDYPYHGLLRKTELADAEDTLLTRRIFTYQSQKTYAEFFKNTVILSRSERQTYEKGTLNRVETTDYTYDNDPFAEPESYLNLERVMVCTTKDGQETCEQTDYGRTNLMNSNQWIIGRCDWARKMNPDASQPGANLPLILDWHKFIYDDFGGRPLNLIRDERILFADAETGFCSDWDSGNNETCIAEASAGDAEWVPVVQNLHYDSFGNLTQGEDARHQTTSLIYDPDWFAYPGTETNDLGHTKRLTYDYAGRLWKNRDVNNQETIIERDVFGRANKIIPPGLPPGYGVKQLVYSDLGMAEKQRLIVSEYSSPSQHHMVQHFLDGFGKVYRILDDAEIGTIEQLNREFYAETIRVTQSSKPHFLGDKELKWFETRFDAMGRPVEINRVNDSGSIEKQYMRYEYRTDGTTASIDALDRITTSTFDELGRLTDVNDPAGNDTRYQYSPAGQLKQVQLPSGLTGNSIAYQWDNWGQVRSRSDEQTGISHWDYDAVGNIIRHRDGLGQETNFSYDSLNRLITEQSVLNTNTYEYDLPISNLPIGRLSKAANAQGSVTYTYDQRGNIDGKTVSVAGLGPQVFNYAYDWQNRLVEKVFPDGTIQEICYMKDGVLSHVWVDSDIFVEYLDYNASRQIKRTETLDGVTTAYEYDSDGRLISLQASLKGGSAGAIQDLAYEYDAVGNLLSINDGRKVKVIKAVDTDATQRFSYDALDRLATARGVYGVLSYDYDALGNLVEKDGLTYNYTFAQGKGSAIVGQAQPTIIGKPGKTAWEALHDIAGNRTRFRQDYDLDGKFDDIYAYEYGQYFNRVSVVSKNSRAVTKFYDDAFGQRIKKTHNMGAYDFNTFYVDESYCIREDASQPGVYATTKSIGEIATITVGSIPGQPSMAMVNANQLSPLTGNTLSGVPEGIRFQHRDHLGSSSVIYDLASGEVARYLSKPFGGQLRANSTGYDLSSRQFTDQELDQETGLYHYGARYYDPVTARFLTPDTLIPGRGLDLQGFNRYSYVMNNPARYIDPSGHDPQEVVRCYGEGDDMLCQLETEYSYWDRAKQIYNAVKNIPINTERFTKNGEISASFDGALKKAGAWFVDNLVMDTPSMERALHESGSISKAEKISRLENIVAKQGARRGGMSAAARLAAENEANILKGAVSSVGTSPEAKAVMRSIQGGGFSVGSRVALGVAGDLLMAQDFLQEWHLDQILETGADYNYKMLNNRPKLFWNALDYGRNFRDKELLDIMNNEFSGGIDKDRPESFGGMDFHDFRSRPGDPNYGGSGGQAQEQPERGFFVIIGGSF